MATASEAFQLWVSSAVHICGLGSLVLLMLPANILCARDGNNAQRGLWTNIIVRLFLMGAVSSLVLTLVHVSSLVQQMHGSYT